MPVLKTDVSLSLATKDDLQDSVELIRDLFDNSVYSLYGTFNSKDILEVLNNTLEGGLSEGSIILLKEDSKIIGILVCSIIHQMFNRKEKTAVELAFWIAPEHRSYTSIKMVISAYKYWAKGVGCNTMLLGKTKNMNSPETYKIVRL